MKPIFPTSFFLTGAMFFVVAGGSMSWFASDPVPLVGSSFLAFFYLGGALLAWSMERDQ